ncbi:MAG: phospholipid carrier-dependent glycosyltransferase [Pseudomonadota bacterium]
MAIPPKDNDENGEGEGRAPDADGVAPGKPRTAAKKPARRRPAKPAGKSTAKSTSKSTTKPTARSTGKSAGKPATKPVAKRKRQTTRKPRTVAKAPSAASNSAASETVSDQKAATNPAFDGDKATPGLPVASLAPLGALSEPSKAADDPPISVEETGDTVGEGEGPDGLPTLTDEQADGPNEDASASESDAVSEEAEQPQPAKPAVTPLPPKARGLAPKLGWLDKPASLFAAVFDGLAKFRVIALTCVVAIAVTAFLPGFTTIPPIDRDESRFSQATRQMVASGDYVDIRFQGQPRYQKPIGIYWLQSAAVHIYGAEDGQAPIWVYRTVSLASAILAAALVYWLALPFGAAPIAFAAATFVALTIMLGAEARLAKTDAALFVTILIAQGILARAFLKKRDSAVGFGHAAVFWTATAAGILIKGPILPMVVGTTALFASIFDRRIAWLRRLRPGYGVFWLALLVLPWFVAIGITSSGLFFEESIGRDLFEKIGQSRERPFVPPGAFTFGFFPSLGWPLAPFAFLAIPFAIATWRDKGTRFLVAWIVPTLLIFELSATKLPHYILPIYPAIAILAGRLIVYEKLPSSRWALLPRLLFVALPVLAAIGLPIVLFYYGDGISPRGVALCLAGAAILILAWLFMTRGHARATFVTMIAGTLLMYWGAFAHHVPAARTIWITPQLASALDAIACEDPELMTLGYREPSLVLMTRTDLMMVTDPGDVSEFLAQGGCRAAFVAEPQAGQVRVQLDSLEGAALVRSIGRVEGININGGDELVIHVLATDALSPAS